MKDDVKIINFSIIAHIDHGKSTLADRILQITGVLSERDQKDQYLDRMEIEQERGITIKSQAVRIPYISKSGEKYILNLIDTPGHVDFSYEVSRSLAACDGCLLVVDASQGIEAQTLANVYMALDNNLEVLPVLNKVDLASAEPELVAKEIEEVIGLDCSKIIKVSAKSGLGVADLIEQLIVTIPAANGKKDAPLKALIFDSWYDSYQGVVILFRIIDGIVRLGDKIQIVSTGKFYDVTKLGAFSPEQIDISELGPGEVGYICASIKELKDARVGDTITLHSNPTKDPFPGFKQVKPMVFCGLYPIEPGEYENLRSSLEKLQLNDAALSYEPETSQALGFGFRSGFLGLLHMEIIQERLEREFNVKLIATAPSVIYKLEKTDGTTIFIDNPSKLPPTEKIANIAEPFVRAEIHVPNDFVGNVLQLCEEKRGIQKDIKYLTEKRVVITYELPFAEIVFDFFDRLKSLTRGFASLDYEVIDYRVSDLVKLDILINGEQVDAMSLIIFRSFAQFRGRELAVRLKGIIHRQLFEVVIQAAIGNKIIAKERVAPMRKDVIAKCYGGDVSRKRKLLEKQKEGKKRMKRMGSIDIPQEAFLAALSKD